MLRKLILGLCLLFGITGGAQACGPYWNRAGNVWSGGDTCDGSRWSYNGNAPYLGVMRTPPRPQAAPAPTPARSRICGGAGLIGDEHHC